MTKFVSYVPDEAIDPDFDLEPDASDEPTLGWPMRGNQDQPAGSGMTEQRDEARGTYLRCARVRGRCAGQRSGYASVIVPALR